ncbi:MAG: hypothetical protein JXR91_17280 [Deltaproteobacteria bacterium]|nr:hypothetical protein [Deltaproteobacteria bacterium]
MNKFFITIIIMASFFVLGCEGDPSGKNTVSNPDDTASSTDSSDTDTGANTGGTDDTSQNIFIPEDSEEVIPWTCPEGVLPPATKEDPANGCYCLRMGVIGIFDSGANAGDQDVSTFMDWLNNDSSAVVTMINGKPEINEAFLNDYDILLFTAQTDQLDGTWWSYSPDESAALKKWIEDGGGIITVTGFEGMSSTKEVAATNSILEPATGISYNDDKILDSCPADITDVTSNCTCWTLPRTTVPPIRNFNPDHPISKDVSAIGSFWGYSINAPDGSEIVASENGANTIVATEIGKGRAVSIADEWPLFTKLWAEPSRDDLSQWVPYIPPNEADYPGSTCYDVDKEDWMLPNVYFQHAQFWYNTIKWAAPENECFLIKHPDISID